MCKLLGYAVAVLKWSRDCHMKSMRKANGRGSEQSLPFCQGRFRRITSKSSLDFFLFCVSRTKGSSFYTKGRVCQDRGEVKSGEGGVGAV
jgi:hypothetical protein